MKEEVHREGRQNQADAAEQKVMIRQLFRRCYRYLQARDLRSLYLELIPLLREYTKSGKEVPKEIQSLLAML